MIFLELFARVSILCLKLGIIKCSFYIFSFVIMHPVYTVHIFVQNNFVNKMK